VEQFSGVSSVKNLAEISNLTTAFLSEIFKKNQCIRFIVCPDLIMTKISFFCFFVFSVFNFNSYIRMRIE
jgi:hypothetical protein